MPRRQLPPEQYCVRCRKSIDGKGWFGPACMCDLVIPEDAALRGVHSTGRFMRGNRG